MPSPEAVAVPREELQALNRALRESEARLQLALEATGLAVFDWDLLTDQVLANARFRELWGMDADEEIKSQTVLGLIHPEDQDSVNDQLANALGAHSDGRYDFEFRVLTSQGEAWVFASGQVYFEGEGDERRAVRVIGNGLDITQRKHTEERLSRVAALDAYRVALGDAIRSLVDPLEIQAVSARVLGEELNVSRAFYYETASEATLYIIRRDYCAPGISSVIGQYQAADFGAFVAQSLRRGQRFAIADVASHGSFSPKEKEAYRQAGIGAYLTVPLLKNGQHVASIAVHQSTPRTWTPEEIALVEETGERTWATVERAKAENSARELGERLQLALDAANMGTFVWYPLEDRAKWDERMWALFGRPSADTASLKMVLATCIHPDDRSRYGEAVERALAPDGAGRLKEEIRVLHPDGSQHWLAIDAQADFVGEPRQAVRIQGTATDISERKHAEERLAESEERFRTLISKGSDMITVSDREGRIIYASETTERVTGYTPGEFMARHPFETIFPDDRSRCEVALRELAATPGLTLRLEHRILHKDGKWRWVEGTFTSLFHEPSIGGLVANIRDITDRKEAEAALQASETHLTAIFAQATVGLAEISLDGRFLRVNDELCHLVGRSSEEVCALTVADLTFSEDIAPSIEALERLVATGEAQSLDKRYLRSDGGLVWASSNLSLLRDARGKASHVLAVTVDLSERRQAEEAVRRSEERLRLMVQSITEYAIMTTDNEGLITSWNVGAEKVFGWTANEVLGKASDIIFTPEDRTQGEPAQERQTAMETGRAVDERWHMRKDGSRFFASGVLSPLRNGTQEGYVKVARDLTREREDEAALRESEERLRIAIDAGELGTWDWDVECDEIHWNEYHFLLFGLTPRAGLVSSQDFASHIYPDDYDRVVASLASSVENASSFENEFRIVREDTGEVRWMNGYGRTIETRDGRATRMSGVVFDSTERHEAQEVLRRSHEELEALVRERTGELAQALQLVRAEVEQRRQAEAGRNELMRRIVNTQEEERGRISRELHDNLGQHLTAMLFGLQALEMQVLAATDNKDVVPQLDNLRQLLDALMKAAHTQARELRPAELDAMGLEAALGQYIRDWSTRTGVEVDFQTAGWEERPALEIETTLYRVAQEALTNVARHANATLVSVVLEQAEGIASIIVEDDGRGFDSEQTQGRLGVLGMRERLALVGGTLEIESIPDEGTAVFARVPLPSERDE